MLPSKIPDRAPNLILRNGYIRVWVQSDHFVSQVRLNDQKELVFASNETDLGKFLKESEMAMLDGFLTEYAKK